MRWIYNSYIHLTASLAPVKIGFRDPTAPNYIEFFAEAEPQHLANAEPDPESFGLPVHPNLKIHLVVDRVRDFR